MGRHPKLEPQTWDFALPGWEEQLRTGGSLLPKLPLNTKEAARAVAIYNRLRLPDVPGQPALAEASGEWTRDIVRAVFGSLDKAGNRHVAEVFALVPKKNNKTTGAAAIMMTALLMNKRPRAEFVVVGPTQEVADTGFQQASGMIEADPDGYLQDRFQVQEHLKTIIDRTNRAKLKIKTFDMKVATGSKPVGILIDELHLMSTINGAGRVIGQLRGGTIANPEAFMIFITTQSDQPPAGVFKTELNYARGVRDGKITESVRMLPMLYEFPEAMQIDDAKAWANPDVWPMVLPNLGKSITLPRLIGDYRAACDKGIEEEQRWASQHLNIQIGMALHDDRWIGTKYWAKAADPSLTLSGLLDRSEVVVAGIDGGGLDDMLGLAIIGRCRKSKQWLLWNHAWIHREALMVRQQIAETLEDFAKDGFLTICDDPTEDIMGVADVIETVKNSGLFPEKNAIGLDPHGVTALVDELASRNIADEQMTGVAQGFRLQGAVLGTERKLKDGTLRHADQSLMAWCVSNAKVEQRGNAVLITKQAAGKAKIDPLLATFDAVVLMSRNPDAKKTAADWIESLRAA